MVSKSSSIPPDDVSGALLVLDDGDAPPMLQVGVLGKTSLEPTEEGDVESPVVGMKLAEGSLS